MFSFLPIPLLLTINVLRVFGIRDIELSYANFSQGFIVDGELLSRAPGDFNGDGFSDLVVLSSNTSDDTVHLNILFGSNNFNNVYLDEIQWNSNAGIRFTAIPSAISLRASFIGDFNNDGLYDVAISRYMASPQRREAAGVVFLIWGQVSKFSQFNTDFSKVASLTVYGATPNEYLGVYCLPAGDINQDGYDDLILGTALTRVYLLFGRVNQSRSSIDLASLSIEDGFRVNTSYMTTAGDFNHDGLTDLLINHNPVFLLFGTANKASFQPFSGDVTQLAGITFVSSQTLSRISFATAGDINRDGYDDILIGSGGSNGGSGRYLSGIVYLIFGRAVATSTTINLSTLPGLDGIVIYGATDESYLAVVGPVGDLNQDGYLDFAVKPQYPISEETADHNQDLKYIIYGGSSVSLNQTIDLLSFSERDGFRISGGYSRLYSIGDWNNDGINEIASDGYFPIPGRNRLVYGTYVITTIIPSKAPTLKPDSSHKDTAPLSTEEIVGIAIGGTVMLALIIAGIGYYLLVVAVVPSPSGPTGNIPPAVKNDYSSVQQKELSSIEMNRDNHSGILVAVVTNAEENL